ncbi:hypothetical protein PR202_ga24893 [Eleusine coracana subsp. coracana]|uniref:UV radiation resistance-associated gene protein n=1 Tax=Eleusine coracana subsp. coracana TaxID=191504 RepID=A0AAV5D9K7_ELECO|nr:hypothetical protein PR202_ga24893 [Eleusine coracana subsp. coracana]
MDDPGPSSAAPDHSPADEEGDRWVLVPASEIEGADAPKVFHWEDLQQELARLWSLSAALQTARARKADLAARLESGLEEANRLLSGENGHGRLKNLEQKLRMRQQHMITQVAHVYPVRPLDEQSPAVKRGLTSIIKTSGAESVLPNGPQKPLAILGLQLSKLSVKKTGYFSDKTEFRNLLLFWDSPHMYAVSLIASYLNVPLRYPLRFGGSRSYILDHAPSVELSSITSIVSSVPPSTSMKTMEFPLFFDGPETTRSSYAIFLLNKDIEQLLNYIGAESLGPRHVLANLKQLTTIIQSQHYVSN